MESFVLLNQSFFLIESWMQQFPGLMAGFTTKAGGVSQGAFESMNLGFHVGDNPADVCSNRNRLAEFLHFPLDHWVGAEQTHDIHIQKISKADCGRGSQSYATSFKATDGFYTDEEGILLTLCFADCVPLYFISPGKKLIGTAHAGWKGTVNHIAKQMVTAFGTEGISPKDIFVAIGPSICEKCYIVDDRVIGFVEKTLEDVEKKPYNLINKGQYTLDLREVNKQILMRAGILEKNIHITGLCSSCNEGEFFSHRRDKGKTGRMISFIGWKEACERL